MEYRIFNVRSDVDPCGCTKACPETVRKSLLKVDSGRRILCRTREPNLHQQRAGLMLYQLSYIPAHQQTSKLCLWWFFKHTHTHSSWRRLRSPASSASRLSLSAFSSASLFCRASSSWRRISSSSSGVGPEIQGQCRSVSELCSTPMN